MASKVVVFSQAKKDFQSLPVSMQKRMAEALRQLGEFPLLRIGVRKLKPPFAGYRKRVGDHRILFDYDDAVQTVYVRGVRNRKDAYR